MTLPELTPHDQRQSRLVEPTRQRLPLHHRPVIRAPVVEEDAGQPVDAGHPLQGRLLPRQNFDVYGPHRLLDGGTTLQGCAPGSESTAGEPGGL
jgi:hypothetical protein